MKKFITERALQKLKADTGGGCSVCGDVPCVNVEGTYWLCGPCVLERISASADISTHAQLMKFYAVDSVDALIEAQAGHIERLQEKLKPTENKFPRTPREG